ncbi:MAG: PorV/PorQ family protein [bacterium]
MKHMQGKAGVRTRKSVTHHARGLRAAIFGVLCSLLAFLPHSAQAQSGGRESIFALGAGARAIGVGGATIAMPVDATTIYWNPAGLELLPSKNVTLFYATLLGGAKYNFLGYAHSSLRVGTFGVGWLHWDVGDVPLRPDPDFPVLVGQGTLGQDQFLVSYAKEFSFALSAGGTIKYERQSFTDFPTTSGVSFDLGFIYRPLLGEGVWQDLSVGLTIQNLIEPRLRLGDETESVPRTFRAGLAKPVHIGSGSDVLNLFLNFKGGVGGASSRYQFGSEYVYQNRAMLRMGYNGQALGFGGGIIYQNFGIDYAYAQYSNDANSVEDLAMPHRLSITMRLGKTRTELIETERRKQQEREENQVKRQLHLQNMADFAKGMEDGHEYFKRGEYFQAQLRYTEASRVFPGDEDARVWVNKAKEKYDEEQRLKENELATIAAEKKAREVDSVFVATQMKNGMLYFNAGDYREAIREWQIGLNRAPGNPRFKELINKTQSELDNRVTNLLKSARSLEAQGKLSDAVQLYNRALSDGGLSASQKTEITNMVARLQTQLNVKDLISQGVAAYNGRDYRASVSYFQEVLKTDPSNPLAKRYIYDAESRLNAKVKEFASEELRQRFTEAARLSQSGNYAAALKILEEIQPEDRYNKYILDAIDQARDKLNRK